MAFDELAGFDAGFTKGCVVVIGYVAVEVELGVGFKIWKGEFDAVEAGLGDGLDLLVEGVFG